GAFLPDEDLSRARAFAVLGSELKEELFGAANALGEFVHVGGNRFRVVGVFAPKGDFLGADLDDMIYIPAARALQMFNRASLMEVDIFYSPGTPTAVISARVRSEEHTSELQSRQNLVCRLLLEKKKIPNRPYTIFLLS